MRPNSNCAHFLTSKFQSTHPLRDATQFYQSYSRLHHLFQSTHPLRDATNTDLIVFHIPLKFQSTHPLRDATVFTNELHIFKIYFNPRTPYGMRRVIVLTSLLLLLFQSTHPLRDATAKKAKSLLEFHSF